MRSRASRNAYLLLLGLPMCATPRLGTESCPSVSWAPTDGPVAVGGAVPDTWAQAVSMWEDAVGCGLLLSPVGGTRETCDSGGWPIDPAVLVRPDTYTHATVHHDSACRIRCVDIGFSTQHLGAIAHEVGHALGAPHSRDTSSVMWPTARLDTTYPTSVDAEFARALCRNL